VQVTVQVDAGMARELRGAGPSSRAARQLLAAVQDAGAELYPTHPGEDDDILLPFFTVEVPDDRAQELQRAIAATEGVEAAYMKPPDALP
jgi:hypothetical protein